MEEVTNELKNIITASYECTEEPLSAGHAKSRINQQHDEMGYDGSNKGFMANGRISVVAIPWLLFCLIIVPLVSIFYH